MQCLNENTIMNIGHLDLFRNYRRIIKIMTNNETFNKLRAPIKTKERPGKGGKVQAYVPIENVVKRINEVFSLDWSFEILREGYNDSETFAVVRIHYPLEDGSTRYKDGVGGVNYEPSVGLGNNLKASVSLALVKAASLLGIDMLEDESTTEQHEQIKALVTLLGGKVPTDERLKALMFTEAAKLVEELGAKVPA